MFSVEEYKKALNQGLTDAQLKMLQLNYYSPNSVITASQMSQGMGWQRYTASSMQYGKLGRIFCTRLNHKMQPFRDGEIYQLHALVDFPLSQIITWSMWSNLAIALSELGLVNSNNFSYLDETSEEEVLVEGNKYKRLVNIFERNPEARSQCIRYYGAVCKVCDFNFGKFYGNEVADFIHVHHLRPISETLGSYVIDPIEDLRPVCPNCHAVIHSRRPAYSLDEVRAMLGKGVFK